MMSKRKEYEANLTELKVINEQIASLKQQKSKLLRANKLLDTEIVIDELLVDAKNNPQAIYLFAIVSNSKDVSRPEERLIKHFGGCLVEEEAYYEARSSLIPLDDDARYDSKWDLDRNGEHDGLILDEGGILRMFLGIKDQQEWEQKGGSFKSNFFYPEIDESNISYDKIHDDKWDWDSDGGRGKGKFSYKLYLFTSLPSTEKGKLID